MGNQKEVFNSDIVKVRLAKEEYSDLSVEKVKQIYLEETGKKLDAQVKVYKSIDNIKSDSGFAGSIIHIYNPKKGINEAYTITRGTEDTKDWEYNMFGLFGAIDTQQYEDAKIFHNKTIGIIKKETNIGSDKNNIKLNEYAIGHSLGGNLAQTLNLDGANFREVTVINDAPPSAYQLASIDKEFHNYLKIKLNLDNSNRDELLKVNPEKLKKLAEEYYAEKGSNIRHLTANDDMLYWASKIRGFIELGTREKIETNPDFSGLDGTLGSVTNLNDQELAKLQMYMSKYKIEYQTGGLEGFIYGATGITSLKEAWGNFQESVKDILPSVNIKNPATSNNLITDITNKFFPFNVLNGGISITMKNPISSMQDIYNSSLVMAEKVNQTVKQTTELVGILFKALIPLLGNAGERISAKIVSTKIETINKILDKINKIKNEIDKNGYFNLNNVSLVFDLLKELKNAMNLFLEVAEDIEIIIDEVKQIKKEVDSAVSAHGLEEMLNGLDKMLIHLAGSGKSYEGNDLVMTGKSGSKEVKVNISSALRIYKTGTEIYSDKSTLLTKMKAQYESEYPDYYQNHIVKLNKEIQLMEASPGSYSYLVPYSDIRVTSISVEEKIDPMSPSIISAFTTIFQEMNTEIETGKKFIEKIRTSIEKMFQEDEKVAQMFKYI
ncbi:DUF6792 domain-containing protein [Rummeliibacillus pycnus]|uniref:DUF6792 domain-containing protein n=1 Tax=Rummeliibacillus pycnus TaxID=101070 RepID=UPI0037C87DCB